MGDAHKHDEKARHASIDYHVGVGKGQFTQEGFRFQKHAAGRVFASPLSLSQLSWFHWILRNEPIQ
jgi:hypothetical protein